MLIIQLAKVAIGILIAAFVALIVVMVTHETQQFDKDEAQCHAAGGHFKSNHSLEVCYNGHNLIWIKD